MNGEAFATYVETQRAPALQPGTVELTPTISAPTGTLAPPGPSAAKAAGSCFCRPCLFAICHDGGCRRDPDPPLDLEFVL